MKRIFYLLLILAMIFAALTTTALAADGSADEESSGAIEAAGVAEAVADAEAIGEAEGDGNIKAAADAESNGAPTDDGLAEGGENTAESTEGSIFAEIYGLVLEYSAEIFALIACVLSALLMLCYKRGMLPLIKGGVAALAKGVTAISGEAKKQTDSAGELADTVKGRLDAAEGALHKILTSLDTLEARLADDERQKSERELFRSVLEAEVNMLYEVFMAAALPEYQKERIALAVSEMRERLKGAQADEVN